MLFWWFCLFDVFVFHSKCFATVLLCIFGFVADAGSAIFLSSFWWFASVAFLLLPLLQPV